VESGFPAITETLRGRDYFLMTLNNGNINGQSVTKRVGLVAMVAVTLTIALGFPPLASAMDDKQYDACILGNTNSSNGPTNAVVKLCCLGSGGYYSEDKNGVGWCSPRFEDTVDSTAPTMFPGSRRVPTDLGTAPVVTQEPSSSATSGKRLVTVTTAR
jgi:hypothetical protein